MLYAVGGRISGQWSIVNNSDSHVRWYTVTCVKTKLSFSKYVSNNTFYTLLRAAENLDVTLKHT